MRILLIEDESQTTNSIGSILTSEGIVCDSVAIGVDGLKITKIHRYDLIVIDIMPPDITGFEILLRLRAADVKIPILILSGLIGTVQKVVNLSSGIDDYLKKPFIKEELVARIKSIVRRSKGNADSIFRFDKVSVNLNTRSVEVDGKKVHLTNKEYALLELLVLRRGTTLTKEMFLNHLYGGADGPTIKIIDVFVCKLRKKLSDAAGGKDYINTVWGRGYMLHEYQDLEEKRSDIV